MELSDKLVTDPPSLLERFQRSMTWRFILWICWHLLHILFSILQTGSRLIQLLACFAISSRFWGTYHVLPRDKLQHLAVVLDSEEAKNITKLNKLLWWLSAMGMNHVILYDMEGVLKKYMDYSLGNSTNSSTRSYASQDADIKALFYQGGMTFELLSFSDGKEGTAKAASILCTNYLKSNSGRQGKMGTTFTESDVAQAMKKAGCGGPEPDLLLIFGPARCHLGFPPWRLRYTEIIHLGPLKSVKYGEVVKAMQDFSEKHQNYGL